jgi:hypothetical protein
MFGSDENLLRSLNAKITLVPEPDCFGLGKLFHFSLGPSCWF